MAVELFECNVPEFWKNPVKPRGFAEFCEMYETQGKITGLWEMVQWDNRTGQAVKRAWNRNVILDIGAINILERAINSSSASPPNIFNNILITNNSGSTTLTSALAANATGITTLAVAAVPAAIPANTGGVPTTLVLGYGGAAPQTVTLNGAVSQGATSITVNSFTVNSTGFGVGSPVVPNPHVAENPNNAGLTANATSPVTAYSGNLSTGAYTFNNVTGAGNRNVICTFTFTTSGGFTAANYSDAWLTNVASGATTNNYVAHEINTIMTLGATNNITATITVKL